MREEGENHLCLTPLKIAAVTPRKNERLFMFVPRTPYCYAMLRGRLQCGDWRLRDARAVVIASMKSEHLMSPEPSKGDVRLALLIWWMWRVSGVTP